MSELTTVKHFFDDPDKIENQGRSFFLRTDGILHNGINIEGTEAVNCMADGKIVAMRLTDDYENINSIKEDESFDDNFLICYHLATKFQSGNIIKDETNNPEKYYFTKEVVKGHSIYKLNSNLKDYDKIEALYFLNEVISNNFVLIEHELIKLNGDNIKFYSLYNHIAPLGRMTYEQKLNLPWYEHKITVSNSKVDGYYTKNNRFLPCEYSVKKVKAEKGILEIIFTDLKSGESVKDQIDASYYSEKYGEIKEKSEQSKQEAGIPIYIIKKNGTRTFKEIVSNETEFEFDFNEIRSFNEKKTKMPLKVKYGDNKEGYIYLNEDKKYDEKTWKEAIEKFWKVINEKKDEEDFLNFQIKFNLKKEFKKNCIAYPNNFEVKAGTKIGYSGFNFMEEDKLAGNVVVLKDGKAKPFTIHVETFFSDKAELEFDYKNEEKWEPFYFKVNSDTYKANLEKPTTKETSSEDTFSMSLIERLDEVRVYSDEIYYKIKIIAKVIDNRNTKDWVKHNFKYHGENRPYYYYVENDTTYNSINNSNISISQKNIYRNYMYLQDFYSFENLDTQGKRTVNNVEYRRVKYFYEPIGKEYLIKADVFENLKKDPGNTIYLLAEDNKHFFIKTKLDATNLLTKIEKDVSEPELLKLDNEKSIELEYENKKINEFVDESSTKIDKVWYKIKYDGKIFWINNSDVKSEKDGIPIEVVSLNDWSKYSSIINLKNTTEYKVKDYKKINHVINTDEEDAKMEESLKNNESSGKKYFDEYKKQKKKNIEGLNSAFKENNNSLSDEIIYKLLKNENKGRNFIFEHRNEWDKNKKLIDAYKDSTKLKKQKFENTLKAYSFMDEVKTKIGNKDTFFYTNPFYFINNLDKIVSIPDFNPYNEISGKKIRPRHPGKDTSSILGSHYNEYLIIKSNPGFTPAVENRIDEVSKIKYPFYSEHYGLYISTVNWCFSCPTYGESNFHSGIDFCGNEKSPIISYINGEVWACTYDYSKQNTYKEKKHCYGKMMFIKGDNGYLYLLGHLDNYAKKEGERVRPGDKVAFMGNTGYSDGAHLHLEVFKCDFSKDQVINNCNENLGYKWINKFGDGTKRALYRCNPLNYSLKKNYK